ncbi:olfactory receptor class A-like protein 1 [Ascaphus truei]|uniref:olfactory receptor class A-like protein 1 n=1 Tax=Ascaphus truei TaxID=8439 RepID=UPI003F597DC0
MNLSVPVKLAAFILQTSLGILGNIIVLGAYTHITQIQQKMKPVDKIFCSLAFSNMMILLTRGSPQIMSYLGHQNILDDFGCISIFYTYRILRGMSISATCLLSVFQAIVMSPATSRWESLKTKVSNYILPSLAAFWLGSAVINIYIPLGGLALVNGTVPFYRVGSCLFRRMEPVFDELLSTVIHGYDFFFIALMLLSSTYTVFILRRHGQQVKYLHSIKTATRESVDKKASKNIIKLTALYVFFFSVDTFIMIYTLTQISFPTLLPEIRLFLSSCYSMLSPFLVMTFNKKIKIPLSWFRKMEKSNVSSVCNGEM